MATLRSGGTLQTLSDGRVIHRYTNGLCQEYRNENHWLWSNEPTREWTE